MKFLVVSEETAVRENLAQAHFWTHCCTFFPNIVRSLWDPAIRGRLLFFRTSDWGSWSLRCERVSCADGARARLSPAAGAARPQITPVNILLSLLRHLAHTSRMLLCVVLTHAAKWGPSQRSTPPEAPGRGGTD